jgi:peptide/nickel transport system ATP-binding protein
MAVVLLSHDLDLVEALSDDTIVLESGQIRERRPTAELFAEPRHDYTRRLLAAHRVERVPAVGQEAPIRIAGHGLTVEVGRGRRILDAVDFAARQGECLAVLGNSGSGKTTLARTIAGLQQATAGELRLDGEPLPVKGRRRTRAERARVQYVFQDARASFDEHRSIADQVARSAVRLQGLDNDAAKAEAERVLAEVGLPNETAGRRRDKLSGGQLQRAALARALAAGPEVLVCDEITSGLDAITQRGVLDLLAALKTKGLTILLITHEPTAAAHLADRILHLANGRAVKD